MEYVVYKLKKNVKTEIEVFTDKKRAFNMKKAIECDGHIALIEVKRNKTC